MSKQAKAVAVDASVMELVADLAKSKGSTNQSVVSVLLSKAFDELNVDVFEYEKAKPRGRRPGVRVAKKVENIEVEQVSAVEEMVM